MDLETAYILETAVITKKLRDRKMINRRLVSNNYFILFVGTSPSTMKRIRLLLYLVVTAANAQHVPTFEEVISLRDVNGITISNDGRNVAITIQTTKLE